VLLIVRAPDGRLFSLAMPRNWVSFAVQVLYRKIRPGHIVYSQWGGLKTMAFVDRDHSLKLGMKSRYDHTGKGMEITPIYA
jgi:hypothetical protein